MCPIVTQFIISVLFQLTLFQCIQGNMIGRVKSELLSESVNDHFLDHGEFLKIRDGDESDDVDTSLNLPRVRRQRRNDPSASTHSFIGDDSRYGWTIYSLGEGSKVNYVNL